MEDVLRVGQALLVCGEAYEAKDALLGRGKEFTTQARFLTLLVQAALADKDPTTALPHARTRLILATEASEIDEALKLARNAIEEGKQQDAVIAELESRKTPAVQERCLLAWLLEGKGRAADAERALTEAPPQDALLALSQLAQLWQNRQQWSKGAEVMEKLFGMPGGRTSAHAQKLVDLYRRAGNYPKALAFLAEWKVLSPGAVQPWLDEARMMTETGRGVEALNVLRAAVRRFDDSMEVATALATACMEAGKAEEAERIYLELYEKTQDNSTRSRLLAPLTYADSRGARCPSSSRDSPSVRSSIAPPRSPGLPLRKFSAPPAMTKSAAAVSTRPRGCVRRILTCWEKLRVVKKSAVCGSRHCARWKPPRFSTRRPKRASASPGSNWNRATKTRVTACFLNWQAGIKWMRGASNRWPMRSAKMAPGSALSHSWNLCCRNIRRITVCTICMPWRWKKQGAMKMRPAPSCG